VRVFVVLEIIFHIILFCKVVHAIKICSLRIQVYTAPRCHLLRSMPLDLETYIPRHVRLLRLPYVWLTALFIQYLIYHVLCNAPCGLINRVPAVSLPNDSVLSYPILSYPSHLRPYRILTCTLTQDLCPARVEQVSHRCTVLHCPSLRVRTERTALYHAVLHFA
jgi:hypothetical protein